MRRHRSVAALIVLGLGGAVPAVAGNISDPAYASHCQMCHQSGGEGLPGQFPRLAGRVGKIAATPGGRRYLVSVVLNGMAGAITVDDQRIVGLMPTMAVLKDGEVASILNALGSGGGKKPAAFTAGEVAKIRGEGRLTTAQVAAERASLAAAGLIP